MLSDVEMKTQCGRETVEIVQTLLFEIFLLLLFSVQVHGECRRDAKQVIVDVIFRGLVIRPRIPETARSRANALLSPLSNDDLNNEFVPIVSQPL